MAKPDDPSANQYIAHMAEKLRAGLSLEVNGQPIALHIESREIIFSEGAGRLPTLKISVNYKVRLPGGVGAYTLGYRDNNFPGRAGWKEIIAVAGHGVKLLNSSVPETDRSARLSDYPMDLLNSPPQQVEARVSFSLAVPAINEDNANNRSLPVIAKADGAAPQAKKHRADRSAPEDSAAASTPEDSPAEKSLQLKSNSQATPRNSFTEIMAKKELSAGIILIALAIAVGLGALHALEPGHGKTLVAAYLVGSRGTIRHAVLLGLIVTAAHTAGVYLLGGITLYASKYIVPERLYPWVGAISGVMIATLGLILLLRRYQGRDALSGHRHRDDATVGHHHDGHHHHHHHESHEHHHDNANQAVSFKQLLALGVSGGIVPCPAALVVLLSAVAMQRIGFGLLLIVAFSGGLAAVLIAVGMLMVLARQFMARFQARDYGRHAGCRSRRRHSFCLPVSR